MWGIQGQGSIHNDHNMMGIHEQGMVHYDHNMRGKTGTGKCTLRS